jgi:hypothetical protein
VSASFADLQDVVDAEASLLWHEATEQQRSVIRFGMLPAAAAQAASVKLQRLGLSPRDAARLLAVAVFACAERAGKPLVV